MNSLTSKMIAASLLVVGMSSASYADTIARAYRTTSSSGTETTFSPVALKNNGQLTLNFNATQADDYFFTYNAECTPASTGWVSVQIVVDGNRVAHPESGTDFAFCSGLTYVGATRTGFLHLTAGAHSVQVHVAVVSASAGAQWRLDDSLLTVEN